MGHQIFLAEIAEKTCQLMQIPKCLLVMQGRQAAQSKSLISPAMRRVPPHSTVAPTVLSACLIISFLGPGLHQTALGLEGCVVYR
jgi:hypothetical protein